MAFYFHKGSGAVNYGRLTLTTMVFTGLFINAFDRTVGSVTDPGMDPFIQAY